MNKVDKSQQVRLIDVFFIAPFMVYFGYKAKSMPNIARYTMIGLGVATFFYNGQNYLINEGKWKMNNGN